jgi:hypothetical protein
LPFTSLEPAHQPLHLLDASLVVDQSVDDLDNRFIADVIVPTLRDERKHQSVFSTHNANIPVLREPSTRLTPVVETGAERSTIPENCAAP